VCPAYHCVSLGFLCHTSAFTNSRSIPAQTIVIDASNHMLGRLSSIVAKQLLNGQQIVRRLRPQIFC